MSITLILILLNVGISLWAWREPSVFEKNAFSPYRAWHKNDWFSVITSSFLHANQPHLVFNMITLYSFGMNIERVSVRFFLLLYLSGMVVSEIGTLFKYKNDPGYRSVGASGAISAVVFSSIWFHPDSRLLLMLVLPINGIIYGALYLLYCAYAANNDYTSRINHDAHFYGSIWGIVFSALMEPASIPHFFQAISRMLPF